MSSVKKNTEPRLRFPKFQGNQEWPYDRGDLLFDQVTNKDHSSDLPILAITQEHGAIPRDQIDYNVVVTEKSLESYKVVEVGDFIISLRSFQGGIEYSNYRGICSPAYVILRRKTESISDFYRHYFKTQRFIRDLTKNLEGLRDGKMVSYTQFSELMLPSPSPEEQQKIADCISSLDELITAENQKLEALQQHKKGLMQQLFPAEGEKVPTLRFKEFRDSGEWKETQLGSLGELISGLTYSPEDVREDGLLVLRSSNIQDSQIVLEDCIYVIANIKGANISAPNDILVCVRNGSKSLIGKSALIPEGIPLSTHGAFMTIFRATNPKFVFQLFQSDLFKKQVAADLGATINSINGSQLINYKFAVPKPEEQEWIADFLSSVDELVNTQKEKVESLKAHKKGLTQQLFPTPGEIET